MPKVAEMTREEAARVVAALEKQFAEVNRGHHENRIMYFGVRDDKRAGDHKECCKLFRGMNPKQKLLFDAFRNPEYKVFTFTGGNRSGKTTSLVVYGICAMVGRWLWDGEPIKFGHGHPRKVRYVGQDWEKHIKTVVEPALKMWWPKGRKVKTTKNNVGVESLWLDEETGSTLEIMSNKQESDLHEGWDGDLVLYDEPPRREIRVANARGLVDRAGREVFGMTLLKEAWVDREVIKALMPDGSPDTSVFNVHAEIYDNLGFGLDKEGIDQFAKTLTEDEKEARLYGKPSYLSGLIYGKFSRATHVRKLGAVPLDWIVDVSIDFHPSKPWAILFLATDKRGFKWVIDEIWQHGSWKVIGEEIVRRFKRYNYRVGTIIIDPLSKGDEQSDLHEESVYRKMQDFFRVYGYDLFTASKDKDGGIHMVNDLLMTENEMPALFFRSTLKRTIMEIEGYMIDPATGRPSKEDDDFMENLYRLVLLGTEWYEPQGKDGLVTHMMENIHYPMAESWM
jgi:hypothetical protein